MSAPIVSADEAQELLEGTTPGPWDAWEEHFEVYAQVTENDPSSLVGNPVCSVDTWRDGQHDPDPDETDCGCKRDGCEVCYPTCAADVRLICAAPRLAATVVALHARVEELLAAAEAFSGPDRGTVFDGRDSLCGGCGVYRDDDVPAAHDDGCPRLAARQLAARIRAEVSRG